MSQMIFQVQSSLILILMTIGVLKRKQRKVHVPIMLTCIVWDVILILQIQLNRSAVQKAVKVMANPMILNIHVLLAISTVVFYGFMILTGRRVLAGSTKTIPLHRKLGFFTYSLRILTYITSFFAVI